MTRLMVRLPAPGRSLRQVRGYLYTRRRCARGRASPTMTSSGAAYSDPSDREDRKTADPYQRTGANSTQSLIGAWIVFRRLPNSVFNEEEKSSCLQRKRTSKIPSTKVRTR